MTTSESGNCVTVRWGHLNRCPKHGDELVWQFDPDASAWGWSCDACQREPF